MCQNLIHVYRVSPAGTESQLSAITIFVTTGRIQVQGNFCVNWAKEEFPLMLVLVDNTDHSAFTQEKYLGFTLNSSSTDTCITEEESIEPMSNTKLLENNRMEEFSVALEKEVHMLQTENLTVTPGRLSVTTLKELFSDLEKEFVDLKIVIDEQLTKMPDDSEIKDKIKQFDSTLKVQAKSCSDKLDNQQQEINDLRAEVDRLNKTCSKLQEQKKHFRSLENSYNNLQADFNSLKSEHVDLKSMVLSLKEDL
mgnify:CR=1 FL=1